MKLIDEKLNHDRVNRLEDQLYWCIRDFYKNEAGQVTRQEFDEEGLLALHFALAVFIRDIPCARCRRQAAKSTKNEPRRVAKALVEAKQQDATPSKLGRINTHTH